MNCLYICLIFIGIIVRAEFAANDAYDTSLPWNLPVFPRDFDSLINNRNDYILKHEDYSKRIPKHMWIAFRVRAYSLTLRQRQNVALQH